MVGAPHVGADEIKSGENPRKSCLQIYSQELEKPVPIMREYRAGEAINFSRSD